MSDGMSVCARMEALLAARTPPVEEALDPKKAIKKIGAALATVESDILRTIDKLGVEVIAGGDRELAANLDQVYAAAKILFSTFDPQW